MVVIVDGAALVLMTLQCNDEILGGVRFVLGGMKLDPTDVFDTLECSDGTVLRLKGKDTPESRKRRAGRTLHTAAVRSLSKFLDANKFPFSVALGGEDDALVISKACNVKILDQIASDEVGETILRGGFTRIRCTDGTARALE